MNYCKNPIPMTEASMISIKVSCRIKQIHEQCKWSLSLGKAAAAAAAACA